MKSKGKKFGKKGPVDRLGPGLRLLIVLAGSAWAGRMIFQAYEAGGPTALGARPFLILGVAILALLLDKLIDEKGREAAGPARVSVGGPLETWGPLARSLWTPRVRLALILTGLGAGGWALNQARIERPIEPPPLAAFLFIGVAILALILGAGEREESSG